MVIVKCDVGHSFVDSYEFVNTSLLACIRCVCKPTVCVFPATCGCPHVAAHAPECFSHMCFEADKLHRWPPSGRQWNRWVQERKMAGASYKGTNEQGGGVERLFSGPLGWRVWTQRDAKHSQRFVDLSLWDQEALPLDNLTPFWHVIHNVKESQRCSPTNERHREDERHKLKFKTISALVSVHVYV